MKSIFNIHNFICTLFIFLVMGLASTIPFETELFNPVSAAFKDFEFTDIVFSKIRPQTPKADTNIVLVNIGDLDRATTAEQINIINRYKPKVIAIDAAYRFSKDPAGDTALAKAFSQVKNLVFVSGVNKFNEQSQQYDTLETSHPMFTKYATTGFANMIVEDNHIYKAIRSFSPKEKVCNQTELAFPVKVAQLYKPEAAAAFLKRENDFEIINYSGNFDTGAFYALDVEDVFDPEIDLGSILKDKIVLMGFLGSSFNDRTLEDKFYTPMNENYIGRSHPDMYGVVIHANSISMILRGEYIESMPEYMELGIAIVLCLLNVILFSYIMHNLGDWYDSLTIAMQLLQAFLIGYIILMLFHLFNIKINLTTALLAIALSSNLLEIYHNLLIRLYGKRKLIKLFKLKKVVN